MLFLITILLIIFSSFFIASRTYKKLESNGNKYAFLLSAVTFLVTLTIIVFVAFLIVLYTVPFER